MSSASALELGASTREQRESRKAAHRAAKLAQRLWEAENPNYDRFLGGADAHLRDWSRVQARLDPDGNGQVEIDTWLHRVQEVVFNVDKAHLAMKRHFVAQFGGMTQAQLDLTLKKMFANVDADGSGLVDKKELHALMERDMKVVLPERDFNRLFNKYDEDRSGEIDFCEFRDLIQNVLKDAVDEVGQTHQGGHPLAATPALPDEESAAVPAGDSATWPGWEALSLSIWFALDHNETGELQRNRFVAWLRRLSEVPITNGVAIAEVYARMQRGFNLVKRGTAMSHSYLTRLQASSAAQKAQATGERPEVDDSKLRQARETELEAIATDWSQLTSQAQAGTPVWTVTQVKDDMGRVVAGPFASYGRHPKKAIETTRARDRNFWIGPIHRTDHSHISTKKFPKANDSWFQTGFSIDVKDDALLTGNPVNEADGIKTIACIHFQATPKEKDFVLEHRSSAPTEILEIACVLINRNTLRIIDEFHAYARPRYARDWTKLSYAINEAQRHHIETADGFDSVWYRLEVWLQQRNVLDLSKKILTGNPTVFVVERSDQLAAILPLQLHLTGHRLPAYLAEWLELNKLFQKHFQCGQCSACAARETVACRSTFTVRQMMKLLHSNNWDDLMQQISARNGDEAEAMIDLIMYGVGNPGVQHDSQKIFDITTDDIHKEYVHNEGQAMKMNGFLYKLKSYTTDTIDLNSDVIADWQLRMFYNNGHSLDFEFAEDDLSGVDCRLLKIESILDVKSAHTNTQEFAFAITYADKAKSSGYGEVILAAETASDRDRWVQGLRSEAAIRRDGGFAVRNLLMDGVKPELARKAPDLLHLSRPASPSNARVKSFLETG